MIYLFPIISACRSCSKAAVLSHLLPSCAYCFLCLCSATSMFYNSILDKVADAGVDLQRLDFQQ